jgi:hypothetical protein
MYSSEVNYSMDPPEDSYSVDPSDVDYYYTIVPVFCTDDIPTAALDLFITRAEAYAKNYYYLLHILDSAMASLIQNITAPSNAPIAAFTSPFEGMTLPEVNEIFRSQVVPLEQFTYSFFVVLDKRSTEDESCLIVSGNEDSDENNEMDTLRTDFYASIALLAIAEIGVTDLGENLDRDEVCGIDNLDLNSL